MFYYHTLKELEDLVNENKLEVWQVIEQSDMEENGRTKEQSYEKMLNMYLAMKEADKNYNGNLKSASKRAGGDGEKIHRYNAANKNICGKFIGNVMEKAIKMGESNACMRRIVAAPTAGACGVLPAVLISYQEEYNLSDDEMVKAMYVAAGIGKVTALTAPYEFLLIHGTSTNPFTGSQVSPNMFLSESAAAFTICLTVPFWRKAKAPAAIALAVTESANKYLGK